MSLPPSARDVFAKAADIVNAWRPLSSDEQVRADYWCEIASRRVRNRWRDVDDRIALHHVDPTAPRALNPLDVRDVVVALVKEVLGGPPVPGARSWSMAAGAESRSVTLGTTGAGDGAVFADWMVEIFEGRATGPQPLGAFPPSGRFESLFEWKEGQ